MKKIILLLVIYSLSLCAAGVKLNYAAEPSMIDYTSYPLFMADTVAPNILIILDNSGSMNFNAYGPWPGDGGTVNDRFMGEPYRNILDVRVSQNYDDAEERKNDGYSYYENSDLDLGRDIDNGYHNQIIGVRFQNIKIPQGADITNAYIEFETYADYGGNQTDISLSINGETSDSAARFETTDHNISGRTTTTASVDWEVSSWDTVGETHQSPDLKAIVQEIVNRGGWSEGNSMAFIITNPGANPASGRRATSHDANPAAAPLLHIEFRGVGSTKYYGYFNPDYFYYWNTNKFDHKYKKVEYVGDPAAGGYWKVEDLSGISHNLSDAEIATGNPATGLWDGNWLNWLCMRRIDVLRKVLMGGKATSRTGGGNQVNYGEDPAQSNRTFIKRFDSSIDSAVSPYDGDFYYGMKDGNIYVDDDSSPFSSEIDNFMIRIQKNILYEPQDFQNYDSGDNLAGILQKYGDKARWGNEFFNNGTGNNQSGGRIAATIGTNMVSLITDLQNTGCDTWTPLAEAYYVAMQYFKQEDVRAGLDYPNNAVPNANLGDDPYWNGTEYVYCAKSFVILLTDGASTKDSKIPGFLKDFDGDGDKTACNESDGSNCDYGSGGTDYLDDVALYARTTDLRDDLEDDQGLILYTVFALADDENARKLLKDAARNGGFEDQNGDGIPNGDYSDAPENRREWDKDGNGIPDTYFEASDGYKLERELGKAITDILAKAASGTAVSVISTSGRGEGNLVQAYFKPVVITDTEEIKWVGYLQSLWLDDRGNIREDTAQDLGLNITEDRIIKYVDVNGETKVQRYPVTAGEPYPDLNATTPIDTVGMEEMSPLWEAGNLLAQRDPDDRKIFTYIDKDKDGEVDETTFDPFDNQGELVRFQTDVTQIKPYLGVKDNVRWAYIGDTPDNRAANLISYIRGKDSGFSGDITDVRIRSRDINGNVWKLGDIIYSTPAVVAAPAENYDLLYGDESYYNYYRAMKDRETVIYVGANDGMLHTFTSWKYDRSSHAFSKPSSADITEQIGDELWAYIPQCLLPHLKWYPSEDYTHVYYVDMKPKVFDAKILPDDAHYTDGDNEANWGTFLLIGLNYGGRHIWAEGDYDDGAGEPVSETRHFYPSYACMDITDPRNPGLLWERTYSVPASPAENASNETDLGLTTSYPSIVKVGEKWFAVFGSGPTDFDGNSDRCGHIFVVDLATGEPYRNGTNDWLFETSDPRAFMASPTSLDKNMNFNVDAIYIGETFDHDNGAGLDWKGALYKAAIPWRCTSANSTDIVYGDILNGTYSDVPNDNSHPWKLSKLFESPGPITAPPAISVDNFDNAWIYFGTGRYFSQDDKTNTDQQYLFGVKDPFFNKEHDTVDCTFNDGYYLDNSSYLTLGVSDLFASDPYSVVAGGTVYENTSVYGSFADLKSAVRLEDGWYKSLSQGPKERNLTKPAIVGGIVLSTTFVPNADICKFGGNSYLYGLYYQTGTAYSRKVFETNSTGEIDGQQKILDVIDMGEGMASTSSIHVGRQEGGKVSVFSQKSTGFVEGINITPALNPRSGLKSWIEK
ncbi:MAG: hypothetical protein J7K15_10600 [Deltaproteobacteria bacterium]|nr:hypothetical protein [Deltaproteobacteria bacterium]